MRTTLTTPVMDLLRSNIPFDQRNAIIQSIHEPVGHKEFSSLLKACNIDNELRANLWDLAYPPPALDPVSERAAIEICREIVREYQAFAELGVKERTGPIQDFILDVEAQAKSIVSGYQDVLSGSGSREDRVACGRHWASSGLWPVDHQTFERPKR